MSYINIITQTGIKAELILAAAVPECFYEWWSGLNPIGRGLLDKLIFIHYPLVIGGDVSFKGLES